ncbi:MAG: hypothetical protein K2Y71_04560 [Xanthobacteraceae bacterium]|nr:hypothetical protein [Xanthobacteraceae bacterium]
MTTSLPIRDFNQELEKTRGAAGALELALKAVASNRRLVTDGQDPSVRGVVALAELLADRLDDLQHMHDAAIAG